MQGWKSGAFVLRRTNETYEYGKLDPEFSIEVATVWLCPNCHSYWHKLGSNNLSDKDRMTILTIWEDDGFNRLLEMNRIKTRYTESSHI